ncbi:MAG: TNT domain-containing protein, partial [Anaeroplasmataceae bacterium]|nr:TNT domain-containing protein [Anaeroplasmataceae bacterium]
TYCYNNPVMYYDPSGHIAFLVLTMLIGAAIGGTIAGTTAYAHGARGWKLFGWTALGVVAGGAIGALAGAGISVLLSGKALSSITAVYYGFKALAWAYTLGGATGAFEFMMNNVSKNYVPYYYYPMNEGFETMYEMTLQPGDVIQRFGGEGSPYVAPYFTDPFSLSLPYKQLPNIYTPNLYVVTKPIVVTAGPAAPWFGQYGGGTQYVLPDTIENLIGDYLKVLQ